MKGCICLPGHLLTREERRQLRMLADDLEAQAIRSSDPHRRDELLGYLANVQMEQANDRATRPRGKRKGKSKRASRPGGRHQ